MNKRDKLIEKYASDLKDKCNVKPDMDLLRKVTIGCGPSIYNSDSSTVSATEKSELTTLRNKFLVKKLGLSENDKLDLGIKKLCSNMDTLTHINIALWFTICYRSILEKNLCIRMLLKTISKSLNLL